MPQTVNRILEQTKLQAQCLELEITESVLMKNEESTIKLLRELKTMGVGLAIDDFGTGYSSLNYLRQFPIDRLKIDRSFVQDISDKPEGPAIVRAIIAMAHNMRLEVTAEGVETEEQSKLLRSWQCDKLQGVLLQQSLGAGRTHSDA